MWKAEVSSLKTSNELNYIENTLHLRPGIKMGAAARNVLALAQQLQCPITLEVNENHAAMVKG